MVNVNKNNSINYIELPMVKNAETVCRQMNVDQSCKFLRDTYLPEWVFL